MDQTVNGIKFPFSWFITNIFTIVLQPDVSWALFKTIQQDLMDFHSVTQKPRQAWWSSEQGYISQTVYELIIVKILCALILFTMIQSGWNFAHATTAHLSGHVQNCNLIRSWFFTKSDMYLYKILDYESITRLWNGSRTCIATAGDLE